MVHARQIVRSARQLSLEARSLGKGGQVLRIGATDLICLLWLSELLHLLIAAYPGLTLEVRTDLTVNLRQLLLEGRLDIAFLAGPVPSSQFVTTELGQLPMQWVAPCSLAAQGGRMSPLELARLPILSHTEGSDMYCLMEEWFAEDNVEPPRFHRCNSLATMIRMVSAGLGITVLPPKLLGELHRKRALRPIDTTRAFPRLSFFVAHPRHLHEPLALAVAERAHQVARGYLELPRTAAVRRQSRRSAVVAASAVASASTMCADSSVTTINAEQSATDAAARCALLEQRPLHQDNEARDSDDAPCKPSGGPSLSRTPV